MVPSIPSAPRTDRRVAAFGEVLAVLVQEQPGAMEDAETFRRSLGGAEANVAIGLAAQGIGASMLTRVGDDGFGRYATRLLGELGVDVAAVGVDATAATGLYVKEVGLARSVMHYYRTGSATSAMTPDYLDEPAVAAALAEAHLVHTTGITPALSDSAHATQRVLVDRVRGRALVSFDVNWRPALWRGREQAGREAIAAFARLADIVLVGLDEAEAVFGVRTVDDVRTLFDAPRLLVVKNDAGIATAFDGHRRVDVAPGRVDVVEAIGAGDAFAAGLLGGILRGDDLRSCVQAGHATAAQALAVAGDHVGARS